MKTTFLKNKQDIINWLNHQGVKNYNVLENSDYGYVVDTIGSVDLEEKNLSVVPVKFNMAHGDFDCGGNHLTSLEFCPVAVSWSFDCRNNQLTTLKYGPTTVGMEFCCIANELISLEFSPIKVGSNFYCGDNKITSLEFCPTEVGGAFYCGNNPALGETQNVKFFSEILKIHKETLILKEKENIAKKLGKVASRHNSIISNKGLFKL